jgi:hypothetical protein
MSKYAVKVCIDPLNDDWIYVTEKTPESKNCWDLHPVLFESSLAAEDFADMWRNKDPRMVKVVTYNESKNRTI